MPPTSSRARSPGHAVTAVLVSHDGARWLPDCLAGLTRQCRPPDQVVAVDTGSRDGSVELLTAALGGSAVVRVPRHTSFGAAVRAGLGAPPPAAAAGPPTTRWLWLLHDDCAADGDALDRLLARADDAPSAVVIGPKTLGWDGCYLLEVGVTVDSSGCRQTGVDPDELDQGQHDDVDDVLAVGTAGMLVRRDVWDRLGGLDDAWPLFGDDVDFGWRVTAAGGRVIVAPQAVVRHAAALEDGARSPDALSGPAGVARRRHGMQVVLANTAGALAPLLLARYVVEGALRAAAALLLARRPRAAADETLAVLQVVSRPGRVAAARRRRHGLRAVPHGEIRPLLAPPHLRWRRAVDRVGAVIPRGGHDEGRRRTRVPVETGPVADEAQPLPVDHAGALRRAASRPGVTLVAVLSVLAVVADRGVLGAAVQGGRLLPAPGGAGALWSAYAASWHPVGLGSTTSTPAWVAVLALLAGVLLGKVWLAVDVLMLGAVPLAGLTAYLAAGRLTASSPLRMLAAATYALLPALTGAVAGGRLDVVASVVLLPLALRAVAAAVAVTRTGWGWHRCFGAGLVLALPVAFAPYLWLLTAATLAVVVVVVRGERALRAQAGRCARAAAVVVAVAAVVLLPWTATVARHPALLLTGAGLPDGFAARAPQPVQHLLLLHPDGPAQPALWVLAPVIVAALAATAGGRHRPAARVGVTMFVVGTAGALAQSRVAGLTPGTPGGRSWTGTALGFAAAGALVAAVAAGDGARAVLRRHGFGWRQPVAVVLVALAVAGAVSSAVTWLGRGAARPLTDASSSVIPVFAAAEAGRPTAPRLLALRASGPVVRYALLRRPTGPLLGDPDVLAAGAGDPAARRLRAAVRDVSAGRAAGVARLAEFGVGVIVVPSSTSAALSRVGAAEGLARVPSAGSVVYRSATPAGELVVLPPAAAAAARSGDPPPADAPVRPLPARAGASRTTLPRGPTGRVLVLAERFGPQWRARLAGHPLRPVRAYGWAQAWLLPPGGGRLVVDRTGGHRGVWVGLQLAAVGVALLLAVQAAPAGRRRVPADRERQR